jgi:hypothetical protein
MSDLSIRSDNVDVEQIMRQIRARIREKRGVDYTEDEIRELATVKLEKFIDPKGVRSDLLEQFRRVREMSETARNFAFEDTTIYVSSRSLLRLLRRLLNPILKLFFNPNPMIEALHIQSRLNESYNRSEALSYELMHNLVLELTRTSIEVKNLKMRLESMASRLDFDERRARALEGVVQYRPGAVAPLQPPTGANELDTEGNERRQRRRRRRGRRRPGSGFNRDAGPGAPHSSRGEGPNAGSTEERPASGMQAPREPAPEPSEGRENDRPAPGREDIRTSPGGPEPFSES